MNEKDTRNSVPLTDDDLTGVTGGEFATVSTDGLVKFVASKEITGDYLMKEIIPDPPPAYYSRPIPDPRPNVGGSCCEKCYTPTDEQKLRYIEGYGKLCRSCVDKARREERERRRNRYYRH